MRPDVGVSRPAMMRNKVDLPQPELPNSAKNSLRRIDKPSLSTTVVSPNFLVTSMTCKKFSSPSEEAFF
jgi:hypothetical protein